MSIVSRWTIGAMASKKASSSSPVSARMASASAGEVRGPVATIDAVPVGGRQAGDLAALDRDQRMRLERRRHRGREAVAVDRERAAGRHLVARRPSRMISEPARRISSCSRPTALVSASSERKELEQTSSARPSVLCASVPRTGPHLVQHHRHAGAGDLPGGFGAGEAAADDVDGLGHAPRYRGTAGRDQANRNARLREAGAFADAAPFRRGRGCARRRRSRTGRCRGRRARDR